MFPQVPTPVLAGQLHRLANTALFPADKSHHASHTMKNDFTIDRDRLAGVEAFLRVAERRSFSAAAIDLGVSASAVSQLVRALEKRVGVPLFSRTTRSVGLTEAGQQFLEHASPAIAGIGAAYLAARELGTEPTGTLRLTAPRPMSQLLIEPVLASFAQAHPKVLVELHGQDDFVDISADGYDAGLRIGEYLQADMIGLKLTAPFPFVVVGSPAYLDRHGVPEHPTDLLDHRCIRVRQARGALPAWPFAESNRILEINPPPVMIFNDYQMNIDAAARGVGLAFSARPLVERHLASGVLRNVLEAYVHVSPGAYLYYLDRARMLPKLRVFIDHLRESIPAEFAPK